MSHLIELVSTERVGQLTGSRDPQGRLLMNGTDPWGVAGVDLGANTEHGGRLCFFFGDVAVTDNGEHVCAGVTFFLPNDQQGATELSGQPDWRFCVRCQSLFWAPDGDTAGSVCGQGGEHFFHPESLRFSLPNDHQGASGDTGQLGWRFCGKCHELFWPSETDDGSVTCPAGGAHVAPDGSWVFALPNDAQGGSSDIGQGAWRYCVKCRCLAWFPSGRAAGSACPAGNARNADLVAWTEDAAVTWPQPAGHDPVGWNFVLPNDHQGATATTGQPDWRFCGKCAGVFWAPAGDVTGSVCPLGGTHAFPDGSWMFVLPNDHQGATGETGQPDWRFCSRCHGLFLAPNGDASQTVCPVDGTPHWFDPQSWGFVLPNNQQGATAETGQPDWRFCPRCHGLFWNGDGGHGTCAALQGGGVHLQPVLNASGSSFGALQAEWPVGVTKSLEAPGGAFSHEGRAYVFVNISPERWSEHQRPGNPQFGTYLISTPDPTSAQTYRTEYLVSPRIGSCSDDGRLLSHQPLGLEFVLPHATEGTASSWRRCRHCAALFADDTDAGRAGRCWETGAEHESDGNRYALPAAPGSGVAQRSWFRCGRCLTAFFGGDDHGQLGRCPVDGGDHQSTGPELAVPHENDADNPYRVSQWRFCAACAALVWTGGFIVAEEDDRCPRTGARHVPAGLTFALSHTLSDTAQRQSRWRHCDRCAALFRADADGVTGGVCPRGGTHVLFRSAAPPTVPYDFALTHDVPADDTTQSDWRCCGKCSGLFWAGDPTGGCCPADGAAHQPGAGSADPGFDFALPQFGPGPDAGNEGSWRFCARCFALVSTANDDRLSGIAPVVVDTADHPFLPPSDAEQTLLIAGFGFAPHTGVRLAYVPLRPGETPALHDTRYYTGTAQDGTTQWSPDDRLAADLFTHDGYTSLSASWQAGPGLWLLLYSDAHDGKPEAFARPGVARLAETPSAWADAAEIVLFDPGPAYGTWMHWGDDGIDTRVPPPAFDHHHSWAYGLHLLNRFTTWNDATRELDFYYLMSVSVPYQVQVMHTRLRITTV